mmetsp:Transcript_810/g.981  ORF Transcript_810/g.981 Transcript_810/m.981 type:complete len:695 (+) Transcript_810:213-2297(+)
MALDDDFKNAVKRMKNRENVTEDDKLLLYALFKQATKGDCTAPQPSKSFAPAVNMWEAWQSQRGKSKDAAKEEYVETALRIDKLTPQVSDLSSFYIRKTKSSNGKNKTLPKAPQLPALPPQALLKKDRPTLPALPSLPALPPQVYVPKASETENLLMSPRLSQALGVNPLSMQEDDTKRVQIYEKIRRFYEKINKGKLNKGIGDLVEWTMEHGEKALNRQLLKKYGENLLTVENKEKLRRSVQIDAENAARRKNIALSQRLRANAPPETREKLDKLTKFLLVNDPELVQRGMYIMLRFIEKKGIGALNENLIDQYGKSLDEIGDEDLNEELKRKYGNDLSILDAPLFGADAVSSTAGDSIGPADISPSVIQSTLRAVSKKNSSRSAASSHSQTTGKSRDNGSMQERKRAEDIKIMLTPLLKHHEPDRFDKALEVISRFGARHGIEKLNNKLKEKYGCDINSFQKQKTKKKGTKARAKGKTRKTRARTNATKAVDAEDMRLKLLRFLSQHDPSRMDDLLEEFVRIGVDSGYEALNNYLYRTYGEHLEAKKNGSKGAKMKDIVMSELHTEELDVGVEQMLNNYYAKYDPMVLATDQVKKIYEYGVRNGMEALDLNLKKKYNESLTEFMDVDKKIREELIKFYEKVDPSKIEKQLENIMAWTMVNGRDALNRNLRKKYKVDLDSSDNNVTQTVDIKF